MKKITLLLALIVVICSCGKKDIKPKGFCDFEVSNIDSVCYFYNYHSSNKDFHWEKHIVMGKDSTWIKDSVKVYNHVWDSIMIKNTSTINEIAQVLAKSEQTSAVKAACTSTVKIYANGVKYSYSILGGYLKNNQKYYSCKIDLDSLFQQNKEKHE